MNDEALQQFFTRISIESYWMNAVTAIAKMRE